MERELEEMVEFELTRLRRTDFRVAYVDVGGSEGLLEFARKKWPQFEIVEVNNIKRRSLERWVNEKGLHFKLKKG